MGAMPVPRAQDGETAAQKTLSRTGCAEKHSSPRLEVLAECCLHSLAKCHKELGQAGRRQESPIHTTVVSSWLQGFNHESTNPIAMPCPCHQTHSFCHQRWFQSQGLATTLGSSAPESNKG